MTLINHITTCVVRLLAIMGGGNQTSVAGVNGNFSWLGFAVASVVF